VNLLFFSIEVEHSTVGRSDAWWPITTRSASLDRAGSGSVRAWGRRRMQWLAYRWRRSPGGRFARLADGEHRLGHREDCHIMWG
jgi:hypothetical protein